MPEHLDSATNRRPHDDGKKSTSRLSPLKRATNPRYAGAIALALITWSVTPLSWFVFLFALSRGGYPSWLPRFVYYYSLLEVPFSLYLRKLGRQIQAPFSPDNADNVTLESLLDRCLEVGAMCGASSEEDGRASSGTSLAAVDQSSIQRRRFRRWFHEAPLSEIKADNVREWLAWAFGGLELSACQEQPERAKMIDRCLSAFQKRLEWTFEPGYNSKCRALRLTLDPVKLLHRPLAYYVVCNSITLATVIWLKRYYGFRKVTSGRCEFLVRPACVPYRAESTAASPIIFLHGLGIGLGQYYAFLKHLVHHRGGVVLLVQPHISVDIWHPNFLDAPTKREHVDAIREVMQQHRLQGATILSHSNGTMVHGWISRDAPELCARNILVDPVCFRLWEGATCYAFVAKKWTTAIDVLLGYFVARELGISNIICRRFDWTDMIFWVNDLADISPEKLHVVLGENDTLLDVDAAREYLVEAGVAESAITVCSGHQHGQALFMPSYGMEVVVKQIVSDGDLPGNMG